MARSFWDAPQGTSQTGGAKSLLAVTQREPAALQALGSRRSLLCPPPFLVPQLGQLMLGFYFTLTLTSIGHWDIWYIWPESSVFSKMMVIFLLNDQGTWWVFHSLNISWKRHTCAHMHERARTHTRTHTHTCPHSRSCTQPYTFIKSQTSAPVITLVCSVFYNHLFTQLCSNLCKLSDLWLWRNPARDLVEKYTFRILSDSGHQLQDSARTWVLLNPILWQPSWRGTINALCQALDTTILVIWLAWATLQPCVSLSTLSCIHPPPCSHSSF